MYLDYKYTRIHNDIKMKFFLCLNNCPLTTPYGNIVKMGEQVIRGGKTVVLHGGFALMMTNKYKKGTFLVQHLKNIS